jgi:hypothetical protein
MKDRYLAVTDSSIELDQEAVGTILSHAAGSKAFNQALGEIVEALPETHPDHKFWLHLYRYSHKAPTSAQYPAIAILCTKEPLTLKEYGDLRRVASLYPLLVDFEKAGFPPSPAQELVTTAEKRFNELATTILEARKQAMKPGDLLFDSNDLERQIKGKKADIMDKAVDYFSPESHACRVVYPGPLSTSHIQHEGYNQAHLNLDAIMSAESYRLDVTKLVAPSLLAAGEEGAPLLTTYYHQAVAKVASAYANKKPAVNAFAEEYFELSILPFTRNSAKKKDWVKVADKFMEGQYGGKAEEPRSMLCSAFTARETVAVLKLTERFYKEALEEKANALRSQAAEHPENGTKQMREAAHYTRLAQDFTITIPFGAHQRLGRMNPHGLVTALQASGALETIPRTDAEKKLFVEFADAPHSTALSEKQPAPKPVPQEGFLKRLVSSFRRLLGIEPVVHAPPAEPSVVFPSKNTQSPPVKRSLRSDGPTIMIEHTNALKNAKIMQDEKKPPAQDPPQPKASPQPKGRTFR